MSRGRPIYGFGGVGGGSAPLTIVGGTTCPVKPTVNMVWVDTADNITGYTFSAAEPTAVAEGMLWIKIGDTGATKVYEALGKEWFIAYLNSTKQYIGGKWVSKHAGCYQNGVWNSLVTYLYDRGKYGFGGTPMQIYVDKTAAYTVGADSITIELQSSKCNRAGFQAAIDFSRYSTMTAVVKVPAKWTRAIDFRMGVDSSRHTEAPFVAQAINDFAAGTEYTVVLDVSTYNGKSNPWFELNNATTYTVSGALNVLEISLE